MSFYGIIEEQHMLAEVLDVFNIPRRYIMSRGENVRVTSVTIRVSLVDGQPLAKIEMEGILPKCKKIVHFNVMPIFGRIALRPLLGRRGEAYLHPADFYNLIKSAPVVKDPSLAIDVNNPDIIEFFRGQAASIVTSSAVTEGPDIDPTYFKTVQQGIMYNPLAIEPAVPKPIAPEPLPFVSQPMFPTPVFQPIEQSA